MNEIRELSRFVSGKKEPRPPHEENLGGADPSGVQLVVDDHRAGAVERYASMLIAKALRSPTIRLPERLAERDLDPGRKVVVVLLPCEIGHFLRDVAPRVAVLPCDLAQEIEAALRPQRRAEGRFAGNDHVRRAGPQLRCGADLRRKAQLSHRWRV